MKNNPLFSVIIPSFNRAAFLPATIASATDQIYHPIEIIVVDDGSTDDTEAVIANMNNPLVKYIKTTNQERGAARNLGVSMSNGEYVYFLDSDDILYRNHFEEARLCLNTKDDVPWLFQHYEFLCENGDKKSVGYNSLNPIEYLVCNGNYMSCHGVFLRKDIAIQFPFVEDRDLAGSEDYALWLRLAARFPLLINPIVTSALIQHPGRSVLNFNSDAIVGRKMQMLNYILNDIMFKERFKSMIPQLRSNTFSYIALHSALNNNRRVSIKYLMKSVKAFPGMMRSRRFWAVIKHILLN